MIKTILSIGLITLSISCSKNENSQKKGIIVSRPKIAVDKLSQISLNFSEIKSTDIDTSLSFNKSICDSLEKHLTIVKQKGNYKGLSIAIGIPQKGLWKSSVGESGTEMPLTTDTKFHALSLGKIFTSALVLKLCVYYNIENKILVSVFSNSNAFDIESAMFYMNEKLIDLIK